MFVVKLIAVQIKEFHKNLTKVMLRDHASALNLWHVLEKTYDKTGDRESTDASIDWLVETSHCKEMLDQGEDRLNKFKVIISSMTQNERKDEKLLHNPERIKRIAAGSGTTEHDVHMLISQFNKMKKLFNTFKNDRSFKKRFAKFGV